MLSPAVAPMGTGFSLISVSRSSFALRWLSSLDGVRIRCDDVAAAAVAAAAAAAVAAVLAAAAAGADVGAAVFVCVGLSMPFVVGAATTGAMVPTEETMLP
jgi:hypothetical protein